MSNSKGICHSKFIKLFFVYLPVFIIFFLIGFVYTTYIFAYIYYLITPVQDHKLYPFSHTTNPESGRIRGLLLLVLVTLFFILCVISLLRVIFMDPGYVPGVLDLEYKIIQKNTPPIDKDKSNFISKFAALTGDMPLTTQENQSLKAKIECYFNHKENTTTDTILDIYKEDDPFNKYKHIDFSKVILCSSCLRWKVERSHHCRQCGKCVLKMDHHCPWLASCIGFRNYKYFLLSQLHGILATVIVFLSLFEALVNYSMDPNISLVMLITIFFSWTCNVGLLSFLLWLFCINWRLMFRGESVIENSDRERFPSAKIMNVYDMGKYQNFTIIFGRNPLVWFIPFCANYEGDGIRFKTNMDNLGWI